MNTIEWLSRLVACDTTSRHSNLQLIDIIKDWFMQHKITFRCTQDLKEKKANLLATIPAHDGSLDGGIILSGHTDVVPVDNQSWDTDPFVATYTEDRIYGRGTCDMKGFLAVMLALVPDFLSLRLNKPIHLAFSYDEEIGCRGAPLLIADLKEANIKPSACIVGEPTNMRPVVAHKGIQVYRCQVMGVAAHSSLTTKACNAIEHAATLIHFIRELSERIQSEGPFDEHFDVPFTSLSTNLINGGNALNIVPAQCEFCFEFRPLPETKPQQISDQIEHFVHHQLLPKMQREQKEAWIELAHIANVPSFAATEKAHITQLARAISNEQATIKVAYASEAGLFQQADIPTIVCGPGDINEAHRANEFVTVEQLEKCETFLGQIVHSFCT